ncbi:ATP-dependent helicase HrpB [Methylobacterium platani]|uniref:ATP-dependent helicase HrpB n=2 Tax=Methylobacterium platani TaxID=427683 RepID=A0A179S702_9HYPH|nr:ATP-dependent helicase HrpB [Methylobacterium platani]KMO16337.1 ATP-dependent helicase [Methylobacterium platani JCM 14648]OAS21503.1 ATP-dependent helicase HrpB [Methylobacterium platani]
MRSAPSLPIDAVLGDLATALAAPAEAGRPGPPNAVLVAPPGAGKTTRVPLALLEAPWRGDRRIVLLEPRRLAARAAAERMAATLGEAVGETVGLRVRLGSKVSARTRIEVVTEGVFARMILDDPELDGVAAVLFDEFHERSLDADLGLALALDAQGALREDLRLVAMSATIDGARVAALMGQGLMGQGLMAQGHGNPAPVIVSEGRAFPVETRHIDRDPQGRIEDAVTDAVMRALRAEPGSVLAFLPGQGEIRRTEERLRERLADFPEVDLAPLYGALDRAEQDRAVRPSPAGRRKVVLATSIAETSLTIEGVRVVVDSGLARVPVYEPDLGLTRLVTQRASRASVDQRRGRAGRTQAGVCYRLWPEAATGALDPFTRPEILAADLAGLVLDCAAWGVADPTTLPFLDPPPAPALAEARALLAGLDALDADGRLTPAGRALRALPLPPRLARMVTSAAAHGREAARSAADVAAVLVERGLGGDAVDLTERVERYRRDRSGRAEDMRRLAAGWARMAVGMAAGMTGPAGTAEVQDLGALVALAYPDRIARARGKPGEYVLANGRGGALDPAASLARAPFLSVAEIVGKASASRILAAAPIALPAIEALFADRIEARTRVEFDPDARALRARAQRRLGAVSLAERILPVPADADSAAILARGLAGLGVAALPWSKAAQQWRERVLFLRAAEGEPWPDLSDAHLAATLPDWLGPHLTGLTRLDEIGADRLSDALHDLVPWNLRTRLDAEAPTHIEVPTGSRIPVDYAAEGGPALAVRVQELFGLSRHPTIGGGRVPLVLHLLSPAQRPIQITRDLPGFWRGSWAAVRADMRGQYPRHPWPEDPTTAPPTRRAKPRGT